MTYVRHRDRMVQESVFEDLANTLIACRWMAGTTTRVVVDPFDPGAGWQIVTTPEADVLRLVGRDSAGALAAIEVIDYFPDSTGQDGETPTIANRGTARINTMAMDDGQPSDPAPMELGSKLLEQPYVFHFAFYAASDALAKAVFNDLRDRYRGDIVSGDFVHLYDYNADPNTSVVRMDVEGFNYARDTDSLGSPAEGQMFFAQLIVTDFVDHHDLVPSV